MAQYLLALFLTIAVEAAVAYLFGLRTRRHMLGIAAINTVTHPILTYSFLVLGFLGFDVTVGAIIILEILVVVAEWRLLAYTFGLSDRRSFVLSFLINSASFLAGLLLHRLN